MLKIIKRDNPQQFEDCFEEVLDKWLKSTPNSTWRTLEVAHQKLSGNHHLKAWIQAFNLFSNIKAIELEISN